MARPHKVLLVATGIVLFAAFLLLVMSENPVWNFSYERVYANGVCLEGFKYGYLDVRYHTIAVYGYGWRKLPSGNDGWDPIGDACPLVVHLNAQPFNLASLTPALLEQAGAKPTPTDDPNVVVWTFSEGTCDVSFHVDAERVTFFFYMQHEEAISTPVEFKVSWKGQAPVALPMSAAEVKQYFGRPIRARRLRNIVQ